MSKVFHRKMYRNIVNVYICIPSLLPLPKLIPGIVHKGYLIIFMPPTLKKWGAYCFRLVRSFVLPSVHKKIQARVLKFHIWIPRQKIAYPYLFSCLNYLPLPSYAPFKG